MRECYHIRNECTFSSVVIFRNSNLEEKIVKHLDEAVLNCHVPNEIANCMSILLAFDAEIREVSIFYIRLVLARCSRIFDYDLSFHNN